MCGIIFAESFVNKDVSEVVLEQYEQQKNRGMQGFGLYDRNKDHLVKSTTEHGIKKWLKKYKASSLMFHHRWPTSTDNVKNACHPFSTKDFFETNYVLVHNGIISNAHALYSSHYERGITYHSLQDDGSFNDSEALLWDVALYLEGEQDELQARGEIAFICIATPSDGRKTRHLYFARNSNPINMLLDENNFIFLSSEGEGEPIEPNVLHDYNYRTRHLETKALTIPERYTYYGGAYGSNLSRDWNQQGNWYDNYGQSMADDYWSEEDDSYVGSYNGDASAGDIYGYSILPATLALTYKKVVEGTSDISLSVNGEMINISVRIRNKVQVYLKEAYGVYELAAELADEDYNTVCDQITADERMGFIEDEDLVLERDIIVAALEVLFSSPYWVGRNSIDPGYELLESAVGSQAVASQTKLIAA